MKIPEARKYFLWAFLCNQTSFVLLSFMVSEPIMASSSTTNSNSIVLNQNQPSQTSFTFTNLMKLDWSNFLLWRKKVLTSIRGNRLESFISDALIVSDQYLSNSNSSAGHAKHRVENPAYINWRAQDQIHLGWLLSTISECILSSVLGCDTSFDIWWPIEKWFGVKFEAKEMQLNMKWMFRGMIQCQ